MINLKSLCAVLAAGTFLIAATGVNAATVVCPSYQHKDDIVIGNKKNLPAGWYAFSKSSVLGVFTSPLDTFLPVMVPNTAINTAVGYASSTTRIDISPDGNWILFMENSFVPGTNNQFQKGYLIKKDGTKRTKIPFLTDSTQATCSGFYRGGKNGNEIYYLNSTGGREIHAMRIDLAGTTPVFGTDRLLVNFGTASNAPHFLSSEIGIAGDIILEQIRFPAHGNNFRTTYVTIPDSGRGTADTSHIYKYASDNWQTLYGCGHAVSPNGKLCLMNCGWTGSSCSPSKWTSTNEQLQMDHKGFIITPPHRYNDVSIKYNALDTTGGISINWVPAAWRFGGWSGSSFGLWYFGKDTNYVIGTQEGTSTTQFGVWMCEWNASKWTLLTPANDTSIHYKNVAFYFTGTTPAIIKQSRTDVVPFTVDAQNVNGTTVFSVRGIPVTANNGAVYGLSGRLAGRLTAAGPMRFRLEGSGQLLRGVYLVRMATVNGVMVRKIQIM